MESAPAVDEETEIEGLHMNHDKVYDVGNNYWYRCYN